MQDVSCILIPVKVFTSNAPAQALPHLKKKMDARGEHFDFI